MGKSRSEKWKIQSKELWDVGVRTNFESRRGIQQLQNSSMVIKQSLNQSTPTQTQRLKSAVIVLKPKFKPMNLN